MPRKPKTPLVPVTTPEMLKKPGPPRTLAPHHRPNDKLAAETQLANFLIEAVDCISSEAATGPDIASDQERDWIEFTFVSEEGITFCVAINKV
jgi:hypothetical protein